MNAFSREITKMKSGRRRRTTLQTVALMFMLCLVVFSVTSTSRLSSLLSATEAQRERALSAQNSIGHKHQDIFLGFVRIPKTGSTSFLSFLSQDASGMLPWSEFVDVSTVTDNKSTRDSFEQNMPFCVYGRDYRNNVGFSTENSKGSAQRMPHKCPHLRYTRLSQLWNKSLEHRKPLIYTNQDTHLHSTPRLQVFTLIRDPFDRLRSLFSYVARFCDSTQHWKNMFTAKQYECICSNDFEEWMKLLAIGDNGKRGVLHQYRIFDPYNLDNAISLIQGQSATPKVLVLLTECFEESLRYLEYTYNRTVIQPGATERFMKSSHYKENSSFRLPQSREDEESLRKLRRNARLWFTDEYKFYDAAVRQFRRQLELSDVDLSAVKRQCLILSNHKAPIESLPMAKQAHPSSITTVNETTTHFAFVRIQKTGSTAMLAFLMYASGLYSWDRFIYRAKDFITFTNSYSPFPTTAARKTPFCVFGHPSGISEQDKQDWSNPLEVSNPRIRHNLCPHIAMSTLEQIWNSSLPFTTRRHEKAISLQAFTIVREPHARLRSLFYYVRKYCSTTQAWKEMFSPEQYGSICETNDLMGWTELLHNQSSTWRGKRGIPYQYRFLSENVDEAISMIEGSQPHVLVLLNECFEESLRLLQHKFSLQPNVVDRFVYSRGFRANTNKEVVYNQSDYFDLQRNRTLRWFAKDFRFYDAAEQQFRRQLLTSKINRSSLINPCYLWESYDPNVELI